MNNIYKSKYILEHLNNYRDNISISQISRLPFFIRNNGLVLSLEYLLNKNQINDRNVGEFILEYILQNKKVDKDFFIEELKNMKSYDYMMLQKDIYNFSVELKSIALSMNSIKKEEKI